MYTTIIKSTGIILLAVVIGAVAVSAQVRRGEGLAPTGYYTGVETARGTEELTSQMQYGNTFVLNSYGEWETHNLTISLNYFNFGIHNSSSSVTGGNWTLTISEANGYSGTLYGEIRDGSIALLMNGTGEISSKESRLNLRSTGGMGRFSGKSGQDIPGEYQATTDMRTGETKGSANFRF